MTERRSNASNGQSPPNLTVPQELTRSRASVPSGPPPMVLIVDDNVTVARALGVLVRDAGWEPLAFHNAAAALKHLEETTAEPAAAVLDVHLPDLNGLVLSQKLRTLFGPNRPIVVLSGDTSNETIRTLPHVGATYFFSKPVNGKHLIDKLRTLLEAAAV